MRIAMIIEAWEPIWGGGQVHVYEICKRLVQKGVEIDLYVMALKDENGRVHTENQKLFGGKLRLFRVGIPKKWGDIVIFDRIFWALLVMILIIRNHRRRQYDMIHAHSYFPGIPGKILSILLDIPIIYTVHGISYIENTVRVSIYSIFERWVLTNIKYDLQITVSRRFLRYPNVNRPVYLPNGVSIDKFRFHFVRKCRPFIILYVGRFDYVKGVDVLLEAVYKIKNELLDANSKIRLVGYGYKEESLKKMTRELDIENVIEFVGKKTGDSLVFEYYNADVFVLPSRSEGFPLTLLEAWASKLPVIATKVGENPYLVKHRYNGWLVEPGNVEELSRVLREALNMPRKKLRIMGIRGYYMIKKKYTWDKVVEKLLRIYRNLVEGI